MAWTQEQKDAVVEAYVAAKPTPENSMDIVKDLAEEFEQSPNGVRMILSKAGMYVNVGKAAPSKNPKTDAAKTLRVSKSDSQEALTAAIEAAGGTPDEEIISKLTGKAAVYFTSVINAIVATTE